MILVPTPHYQPFGSDILHFGFDHLSKIIKNSFNSPPPLPPHHHHHRHRHRRHHHHHHQHHQKQMYYQPFKVYRNSPAKTRGARTGTTFIKLSNSEVMT